MTAPCRWTSPPAVRQGTSSNLSDTTIDRYVGNLEMVFRAVGLGPAGPASVTTARLRDYMASLQARGLAPQTVAGHVTVLKRFFGFLLQAGHPKTDPSRGLPTPKVGRRLPKTLSVAELGQLFAAMDDTTRARLRDKVFFQLTYAGGPPLH